MSRVALRFENVSRGMRFYTLGNSYIRIPYIEEDDGPVNCVNLDTGRLFHVEDHAEVEIELDEPECYPTRPSSAKTFRLRVVTASGFDIRFYVDGEDHRWMIGDLLSIVPHDNHLELSPERFETLQDELRRLQSLVSAALDNGAVPPSVPF